MMLSGPSKSGTVEQQQVAAVISVARRSGCGAPQLQHRRQALDAGAAT